MLLVHSWQVLALKEAIDPEHGEVHLGTIGDQLLSQFNSVNHY